MIASFSGRVHGSMNQSDVEHISRQLRNLETGGDLRNLGLAYEAKPLALYLTPATFDIEATLQLLNESRLRAVQIKLNSLSSKVDVVYARRIHLLTTLSIVAAIVGLGLLLMFIWLWRQSNGHWSNEISLVQDENITAPLNFDDYLQSVVEEEVKFVGHRASLSCKGFDVSHIDFKLLETVELIAEQLVRNSIEHGGRPAETRLLAGKTDYLSIRVILQEQENCWLLTVWDNGEGLDGAEILETALYRKLISESSATSIAAEQRLKLIFLPGFTTREVMISSSDNDKPLSELRAICQFVGGTISVQNQRGDFCQFTVRFPKS